MAKELPYYKFEPNQWENGNIQMCSREDKGLFIDLCALYWSRLGDVPFKLAKLKLCAGNETAFDSLINEEIFTIDNDMICIDFLNEQLLEFENLSKQNSKNAKDGWLKRRETKGLKRPQSETNATASNSQSEKDAIREEKRKEEEIKEEKPKEEKTRFSFRKSLCNLGLEKTLVDDFLKNRKLKRLANTETAFNNLVLEFNKANTDIDKLMIEIVSKGWGSFKNSWMEKEKEKKVAPKKENAGIALQRKHGLI